MKAVERYYSKCNFTRQSSLVTEIGKCEPPSFFPFKKWRNSFSLINPLNWNKEESTKHTEIIKVGEMETSVLDFKGKITFSQGFILVQFHNQEFLSPKHTIYVIVVDASKEIKRQQEEIQEWISYKKRNVTKEVKTILVANRATQVEQIKGYLESYFLNQQRQYQTSHDSNRKYVRPFHSSKIL